jgi:hypothetical protein
LLFTLPEREVLLGRSDGSGTAVMSESGEPESPLVARKSSSCRSRSLTRLRLQTDSCTSPPIPDTWTWKPGEPAHPFARGPWLVSVSPSRRRVARVPRTASRQEGPMDATTELFEWRPRHQSSRTIPVEPGTAPFSISEQRTGGQSRGSTGVSAVWCARTVASSGWRAAGPVRPLGRGHALRRNGRGRSPAVPGRRRPPRGRVRRPWQLTP